MDTPQTRNFNGRNYTLHLDLLNGNQAQANAAHVRALGYWARVTKETSSNNGYEYVWQVWKHEKPGY
jgi:hypothetical protein